MKWLKYFGDPRRVGPLRNIDCSGRAGGECGDRIEIQLRFDGEIIADAAFLAAGCPAAIAGAAACAELLPGRTLLGAASIGVRDIAMLLEDLPPDRETCLYLSIVALGAALERYIGSESVELAPANRVVMAMSGGVDSSTAAFRLLDEGYEVVGLTQRLHDYGRTGVKSCCTPADIDDAREVAALGGFSHLTVDMRDKFSREVIDSFCASYISGRTPNPCIECNRRLRFNHLIDLTERLGAAKLATGHYVRIIGPDKYGRVSVRRAVDVAKDQSYVFWSADERALARLRAPLGDLTKGEVREIARAHDLPVAGKSDSQDVCFVPDGDYVGFVCRRTGYKPEPGQIEDVNGAVVGLHKGLIHYTIGQRRGIGVAAPEPLYVTAMDAARNTLVVGTKENLNISRMIIGRTNFIGIDPGNGSFKAQIMMRYNGEIETALVHPEADDKAVVEFDSPFGPVAPGQSAVFYDGELVLGGGIIEDVYPAKPLSSCSTSTPTSSR